MNVDSKQEILCSHRKHDTPVGMGNHVHVFEEVAVSDPTQEKVDCNEDEYEWGYGGK